MEDLDTPTELKWQLLACVQDQGAKLSATESILSRADTKLRAVDANISRIRAILKRLGVDTKKPVIRGEGPNPYMLVEEFSCRMRMKPRAVRDLLRAIGEEGVHYDRQGRKYRVHVEAAERLFVSQVVPRSNRTGSVDMIDLVTRQRAKVARRNLRSASK